MVYFNAITIYLTTVRNDAIAVLAYTSSFIIIIIIIIIIVVVIIIIIIIIGRYYYSKQIIRDLSIMVSEFTLSYTFHTQT
jgi:hypothetical protein